MCFGHVKVASDISENKSQLGPAVRLLGGQPRDHRVLQKSGTGGDAEGGQADGTGGCWKWLWAGSGLFEAGVGRERDERE